MGPQDGSDRVIVQVSVVAADIRAFRGYLVAGPQMAILHRNRRLYLAACFVGGAALSFTDFRWTALAIISPIALFAALLRRSSATAQFELIRPTFEGELTADANGLTLTRPGVTSHVDWSALHELVVTDALLFARSNPVGGYVIPKRCLRDAGDVDRLIRWRMAAKVGANKPPPPPPYLPPAAA
jgi:hypothetical protein